MRENKKDDNKIVVNIIQFIFALILITMIGFSFIGCSTFREIPVQQVEKIVYRDSLIFVKDTIEIEVEKQVIKEVLPQLDTSVLKTDLASSVAYLDTNRREIHHELKQEGKIKTIIDTCYITKTVEKIREVEVPIEVEVEKIIVPDWAWISLIFNIITILIFAFRIYLKMKLK